MRSRYVYFALILSAIFLQSAMAFSLKRRVPESVSALCSSAKSELQKFKNDSWSIQLNMEIGEMEICKPGFRFWFWETLDIDPILEIKNNIKIRKYWMKIEKKDVRVICSLTSRNFASYGNDPWIKRWIVEMAEIPLCQNEFFTGLHEIFDYARDQLAEIQLMGTWRIMNQVGRVLDHTNPKEREDVISPNLRQASNDFGFLIFYIIFIAYFSEHFRLENRIIILSLGLFKNILLIFFRDLMRQELKVQHIIQERDQVNQNLAKHGCLMKGQEFSDLHSGLDNMLSVIL